MMETSRRWAMGRRSRADRQADRARYIVEREEDLDRMTTWSWSLFRGTPIALSVDRIPHERARKWEELINKQARNCGCVEGELFLLAGVVGCCILPVVKSLLGLKVWSPSLWQGIVICVCASIAGKAAGLLRRRFALVAAIRRLRVELAIGEIDGE
jgi:hypothetical protein